MFAQRTYAAFAKAIAVIATLLLCLNAAAASTGKRVALVIGNSTYKNAVRLPNTLNDAQLMANTLKNAGFEVIEGTDLSKTEMSGMLDRFTELAYNADLAMVFYAGHGMQVEGKNYLVPTDAVLNSPAHLKTRAFTLDDIIATLPADPGVGVVILDACRDNPLARTLAASMPASRSVTVSSGLAPVQASSSSAGTGTGGIIIAYATDPGAVALDGKGDHSPYTSALAKHLATPGLEIQSALTRVRGEVTSSTKGVQRPWHNASLGREIFVGGQPKTPSLAVLPADDQDIERSGNTDGEPSQWAIEQRFWDEVSKRDTVGHYEAYLKQFPNGRFTAVARLNIENLNTRQQKEEEKAKPDSNQENVEVAAVSPADVSSQTRAAFNIPDAVRSIRGTPETDQALALDRNQRVDLQLRLTAVGHNAGGADGVIGPNSRKAIAGWQEKHGIPATTYLTQDQLKYLKLESDPLMAAIHAERERQAKAAARQARKNAKRKVVTRKKVTKKRKVTKRRTARRKVTKRRTTTRRPRRVARERHYDEEHERRRRRDRAVGAFILGAGAGIVGCKIAGGC